MITGADGFVGSHLARELVSLGASVHALVHRQIVPASSGLHMWGLIDGVRPEVVDVIDRPTVISLLTKVRPSFVFHLAAQTIVSEAQADPLATIRTNVLGTCNVLEACAVLPKPCPVVVASSDKAYGPAERLPYVEEMPLRGSSIYDSSKACAESLARSLSRVLAVRVAVTRCSNIYGPGDLHYSRIVPDVARMLAAGQPPVIRGDGSQERDFMHVVDAVSGYLALGGYLLRTPQSDGEVFNFGTGEATRISSLVELMISLSRHPHLQPTIVGRRASYEIPRQCVDSQKALRLLGWKPIIDLRRGLMETINWYGMYLRQQEPS